MNPLIDGLESAIRLHRHGWLSESELLDLVENIIKEKRKQEK